MKIRVNGEEKEVAAATVEHLLESLAIDPRRVAVEFNRTILPRDRFADSLLREGDALEIVQFVGGG